jgi:hypothetical protein
MNENDPLEETISRFREISPPANVQNANRRAVEAALRRPVAHWWQRGVTVPLPAVLATAAALILSLSVHVFHARLNRDSFEPSVTVAPSSEGGGSAGGFVAAATPRVEYSETQSYLSGVGVISRNMVYRIKE